MVEWRLLQEGSNQVEQMGLGRPDVEELMVSVCPQTALLLYLPQTHRPELGVPCVMRTSMQLQPTSRLGITILAKACVVVLSRYYLLDRAHALR